MQKQYYWKELTVSENACFKKTTTTTTNHISPERNLHILEIKQRGTDHVKRPRITGCFFMHLLFHEPGKMGRLFFRAFRYVPAAPQFDDTPRVISTICVKPQVGRKVPMLEKN